LEHFFHFGKSGGLLISQQVSAFLKYMTDEWW